jgi:PAS domain S-box-containing protein
LSPVASEAHVKLDGEPPYDPKQLLTGVFRSSRLGFAILDDHLRFQTINKAFAEMNGVPLEAHLGKTIREILGPLAAAKLEPKLAHVFAVGETVSFPLETALPTRTAIGHWAVSYFPIERLQGHVTQVCAIVTELTIRKQLELNLFGFSRKLLSLRAALKSTTDSVGRNVSGALLDSCISEMVAISQLPESPLAEITPEVLGQYDQLPVASVAAERLPINGELSASILSRRARQVVQHLAQGQCSKQIAHDLGISVRTVETYRAKIKIKLGIRSVAELTLYAHRNNIV